MSTSQIIAANIIGGLLVSFAGVGLLEGNDIALQAGQAASQTHETWGWVLACFGTAYAALASLTMLGD